MAVHRLPVADLDKLHMAAQLVREVCDAHPMEMTIPILDHMRHAVREIGVVETLLDAA